MHHRLILFIGIVLAVVLVLLLSQSSPNFESLDVLDALEAEYQQAVEDPPEVRRLAELSDEFAVSLDPLVLIEIGDLHRKGAYPRFKSDPKLAKLYYELAADLDTGIAASIANAKYIEAATENIPEVDNVGRRLHDIYFEAIQATALNGATQQRIVERNRERVADRTAERAMNREVVQAPPLHTERVFLNDEQNVHDHALNKITRKNIDTLKSLYRVGGDEIKATLEVQLAHQRFTDAQKAKISNVINSFSRGLKQFDCTEVEVLSLVYQHVKDKPDLLRNLFLQLEDCYHHGSIVCTTGKISRIISVVGDTEGFEDAKNIYYIKDELQTLAAKVRDDYLKTLTKKQVSDYNAGLADETTEAIKKIYEQAAREQYCVKLGLAYSIIKPHLDLNALAF